MRVHPVRSGGTIARKSAHYGRAARRSLRVAALAGRSLCVQRGAYHRGGVTHVQQLHGHGKVPSEPPKSLRAVLAAEMTRDIPMHTPQFGFQPSGCAVGEYTQFQADLHAS